MVKNEIDILLVEDNPNDAELAIRALKKQNPANNIFHVSNGEDAMNYLFCKTEKELCSSPKIILLDLKMPRVNGIELLRALKSDDKTKLIPVVILTSSREDSDVAECYKLGVNSYIVKPVEFNKFIRAVSGIGLYWLFFNQPPPHQA